MEAIYVYVEKIYNLFEEQRKKHKSYRSESYNKEAQYKELIKFLIEREEVTEAELMLKSKEIELGKLYYNTFIAIMRRYLGFIDVGEEDGYKIIKITNELKNALNDDNNEFSNSDVDSFGRIQLNYEDFLKDYIKNNLIDNITKIKDNIIKISMRELYSWGLAELLEYALESMENYYKVKDWIEELINETIWDTISDPEHYTVVLVDFPKEYKININDISSKYINKVVEFEGNIVYASSVESVAKRYLYECFRCGKRKEIYFKDLFEDFSGKLVCECGNEMEFREITEFADFQELIVQGFPDEDGYVREQRVLYEHTQGIFNGYVRVIGIVRPIKRGKKKKIYDLIVQAINIEKLDNYTIKLTEEDINNIKKISRRKDVVNLLSDRLIPEIKGHSSIKKAVFLQQIKGVKTPNKRENINILLITDPGVGKTVILRKIAQLPGNNYVNIPTATVNSIIGIAEKKQSILGESFVLKLGVIPRTLGTLCVDEFYLHGSEYQKVLEAFESDTITIDKGGIHAVVPIQCGYLCACNPKRGRFDRDMSVSEQIHIPPNLLSRFDLIFPIMDNPDVENDEKIAEHIIDVHRAHLDEDVNKKVKLKYIEVDGVRIDESFIVKYIHYARQLRPLITEDTKKKISRWYAEMRKKHQITARLVDAVVRLAEAHAKAKLKETVDVEDAEEAINIITECLKQIAYDPETGQFDIDKIMGMHKREREKLNVVLEAIKEISNIDDNNLAIFGEILEKVENKGINKDELERLLKKLKTLGDIDEPKPGRYRLL